MYKAKLISSTKEKFEEFHNKEGIFLNSQDGIITLLSEDTKTKQVFLQTPIILHFEIIDNFLIIQTFNGFFSFEFLGNKIPEIKISEVAKLLLN